MTEAADQGRLLRGVLGVGGSVALVVAVVLALGGARPTDAAVLGLLVGLLPALSIGQLRLLPPEGLERASAYVSSIVSLVVLGAVCLVAGVAGRGLPGVGLIPTPVGTLVLGSVALTGAALAVMAALRALSGRFGYREAALLTQLLPETAREKRLFAVLSLCAGFGEEVAYRGFFITAMAPVTGGPVAALLGSLVFGILHVYQGWLGVLRASVLGGLFAAGFLVLGSLWPAVVAHVAVDLLAGLVLRDWLLEPTTRPRG